MKELFLISGLGADRRVFEFLDLREYKLNFIEWIQPLRNESIESYARQLLDQIHRNDKIFPNKITSNNLISGGGHFMIVNKQAVVSSMIRSMIS